jgi:regulatory protein
MTRPAREPRTLGKTLGCHDRALRLLAVRARSRRELERRLLRAGFDRDEVRGELDRLEGVGLVDDEAFARQVAAHEFGVRRSGRRVVTGALISKGVAPAVIENVLSELDDDEDGRIDGLARSRAARLTGIDPATAFGRLTSFLIRRGYDPGSARTAARRALEVEGTDD